MSTLGPKLQADIFERLRSVTIMANALQNDFSPGTITIQMTEAIDAIADMQRDLKFVEDALSTLVDWEKEV